MKKLIVLSLCLISMSLYAQEIAQTSKPMDWKIGALGGAVFSDAAGLSTVLEFKSNYLLDNLYSKISVGYSYVVNDKIYNLKDYKVWGTFNAERMKFETYYEAYDFDITRTHYNNIPVSLGLEYYFPQNGFSPYALFELGINMYYIDARDRGNFRTRRYETYEEVPDEYINQTYKRMNSLRAAIGAGTNIKLFSGLDLDVRGVYQISNTIGNYGQLLAGFVF